MLIKNKMVRILILLILCFVSCKNNGQDNFNKENIGCAFSKKVLQNDTLMYTAEIICNQNSIEFITMLYDTSVIPREVMGIEDNVIKQTVNFKSDNKLIKSYDIPSVKALIGDIYGEEIKKEHRKRQMTLNHVYTVKILQIDNEYFYVIKGGENLIDKREYFMICDLNGDIVFENYLHTKGDLVEFLKEKEIYEKWTNNQLIGQDIYIYPFELCCKQKSSNL